MKVIRVLLIALLAEVIAAVGLVILFSVSIFGFFALNSFLGERQDRPVIAAFQRHQESFETVAEFIRDYDFSVYTPSSQTSPPFIELHDFNDMNIWFHGLKDPPEDAYVTDADVVDALHTLYKRCNYSSVHASYANPGCVVFYKDYYIWGAGWANGMAYTVSGEPPTEDAIFVQSPSSLKTVIPVCDHWYYWYGWTE